MGCLRLKIPLVEKKTKCHEVWLFHVSLACFIFKGFFWSEHICYNHIFHFSKYEVIKCNIFVKNGKKLFCQQMSALCTTFLYMSINHYSISIKSSKNKTLFQISVYQKIFALLRAEEKKIIFFETLLFTLCIILRNSSSFIKILKEDRITFPLISNILKGLNRGRWNFKCPFFVKSVFFY